MDHWNDSSTYLMATFQHLHALCSYYRLLCMVSDSDYILGRLNNRRTNGTPFLWQLVQAASAR